MILLLILQWKTTKIVYKMPTSVNLSKEKENFPLYILDDMHVFHLSICLQTDVELL